MAQIFYIDSDEEIIGAIGRLRHSPEPENYFVFPKRALILQSIINLRLFQKEAQKMNKTIILVTQDEIGRMLAEKAGIKTEPYSDEFAQKANHLELRSEEAFNNNDVGERAEELLHKETPHLKAEAIGSSSFFSQPPKETLKEEPSAPIAPVEVAPLPTPSPKPIQKLRIRNVTPERPPGLNSVRTQEAVALKQPATVTPDITPVRTSQPSIISAPSSSAHEATQTPVATNVPSFYPQPASATPSQPSVASLQEKRIAATPQKAAPKSLPGEKKEFLKNFFAPDKNSTKTSTPPPKQAVSQSKISTKDKEKVKTPSPVVHGSAKKLLYFFALISLLSVGLLLAYLFFPKVTVKITPYTTEEKIESSLRGVTSGGESLDTTQVRLLERDISVKVTGTATDTSASTTEKARGTLVIYNDFSADPQSLVATTRFETSDGKVFLLEKSTTIPGKTSAPGAIEVNVIADQAGSDFNIEPTTFTIPGFKGTPKFDKITGKSTKAMAGGGTGGSEVHAIARADLDKAEAAARTEAEKSFMTDLEGSRVPGEFFLKESLELTPQDSGNRPREGLKGETFEYERTYKAKAFLVQENMLKQKIEAAAQKESNGVRLEITKIDLDYGEIAPNFTDSTVSIRLHALVHKQALIDSDAIKMKLLGRNAEGIQAFLGENPGVQKIELEFNPKWFGTSIPKSTSRVSIVVSE